MKKTFKTVKENPLSEAIYLDKLTFKKIQIILSKVINYFLLIIIIWVKVIKFHNILNHILSQKIMKGLQMKLMDLDIQKMDIMRVNFGHKKKEDRK